MSISDIRSDLDTMESRLTRVRDELVEVNRRIAFMRGGALPDGSFPLMRRGRDVQGDATHTRPLAEADRALASLTQTAQPRSAP